MFHVCVERFDVTTDTIGKFLRTKRALIGLMMHADDTLAGRRRMQMQSSREEREARERLAAACGLPHVPAATLFSRRENPCTLLHLNLVITLWNSDVYVFDKFVAFLSSYIQFLFFVWTVITVKSALVLRKRTMPITVKRVASQLKTRPLKDQIRMQISLFSFLFL